MALAIGRTWDQVRVLSDLSGSVVGALLDDEDTHGPDDAFSEALRRYRVEGAPDVGAVWRRMAAPDVGAGGRAAEILRHLTRDLLERVSTSTSDGSDAESVTTGVEMAPTNVHAIRDARDVPALELASDGTWRPSSMAVSAQDELDAGARRRANVPALESRYPSVRRDRSGGFVLPPAPPRFTQVTMAPIVRGIPAPPSATPPVETIVAYEAPAAPTIETAPAPARVPQPQMSMPRESIIKAVAAGTEIVAGPFARFQQLAAFVKALRAVKGVQDVTTRQFVRGTVHLRVRHSQTVDLGARIQDLTEFAPQVLSSTPDRIELRVEPTD